MSRHNYTQYSSNKGKKNANYAKTATPAASEVKMEPVSQLEEPVVLMGPIEVVAESVRTTVLPEIVDGVVAHCAKLNVRSQPDISADVVCILDAASEIAINVNESTSEWFKVCTATGVEGYCMRKFVDAHL